ncbi:hypothetical protein FXO37_11173 [Capsicum annuum]|nr:hypothetical protein FXO37_11173 [Capsicum annuum]
MIYSIAPDFPQRSNEPTRVDKEFFSCDNNSDGIRPMHVTSNDTGTGKHIMSDPSMTINGHIFSLAYDVLDSENVASWTWFFKNLKEAYGERNICGANLSPECRQIPFSGANLSEDAESIRGVYVAPQFRKESHIGKTQKGCWDCVGAIDGTYVQVEVQKDKQQTCHNRKRFTSQNVLCAYDFDIQFTFIIANWEVTAHDSRETTDELIDGRNASHITPTALDRWEGRLEDVFSGQPFDMLNAALSDTVSKIPADIQVLEPKSLSKLLEAIDPSQLPDCLGGSCTCSTEGLCLRSNKGPWSDPQIMKVDLL